MPNCHHIRRTYRPNAWMHFKHNFFLFYHIYLFFNQLTLILLIEKKVLLYMMLLALWVNSSNAHLESDVLTHMYIYIYIFARVSYISWVGLWLPIGLDSCLYCDDAIKSKLIYGILTRPKIRPKRACALNWSHVKTHFFMAPFAAGFAAKGLLILMASSSCGYRFGPFCTHHFIWSNSH